jgi:cation:H+ antiporter
MFLAGMIALLVGAELMVRGASRLATRFGVSPLVIGLTVVAYGTRAPELAVSLQSAWLAKPDLALGNVVGSNIFNILFVLGISALVTPMVVDQQVVRREVPLLIGVSLGAWMLCLDGQVSRLDGVLLAAGAVAYTVFAIRASRRAQRALSPPDGPRPSAPFNVALAVVGVGLLVLGADWLVDGATGFARAFGVSELVIGLTIVAGGTSLPEVATSVVAAVRGERDMAVGNVVGSNLFNLLAVLGATAALAPGGMDVARAVVTFDMPVMLAATVACLPILLSGHRIDRWEGGFFVAYYVAYAVWTALAAAQHDALEPFSMVMLSFALPLTVLTLAIVGVRALRS